MCALYITNRERTLWIRYIGAPFNLMTLESSIIWQTYLNMLTLRITEITHKYNPVFTSKNVYPMQIRNYMFGLTL